MSRNLFGKSILVLAANLLHFGSLTASEKTLAPSISNFMTPAAIPGANDFPGYRGFVVSHTHSDASWTDTPEVCLNLNVAAIAKSVEIAEKQPKYRFTLENVLSLREYVRRHPDKVEVLKRLMRAGAFETGAFYTGPWELTCGGEGLIRELYLGKLWVRKHLGGDPATVWNVDVAGHTSQMPQILHKAGIRGLVISAGATDNTFDNPYLLHQTRGPFLFRWQAPDGTSIPTWSTPWGYASGGAFGMRNNTVDAAKLADFLKDVQKNHDAHGLPKIAFITDGTDNETPSARVGENIARWNAEKRFPPLVSASTTELFRAVEGHSLPTFTGEMPSPWDQVQSQGNDCFLLDRRLEGRLLAAEKFATFAHLVSPTFAYPQERFQKIWENRLFAVEHNWGGKNGDISNREKTEKIREATQINDRVLQSALRSLTGQIRFGRSEPMRMVVFNPLSWERKDIVTCSLPISQAQASKMVVVDNAGAAVAHQLVGSDWASGKPERTQIAFCAQIPSLGYATFYLSWGSAVPRAETPFQVDAATNRFENDFYRIVLDANSGGIKSWYDKRGQKELIRQNGKYTCAELLALEDDDIDIRCHFTGKQWLRRERPSTVRVLENGPVCLVVEATGGFLDRSTRSQKYILYRDLARMDLITTLAWEGRKNVCLYQVFPFQVTSPKVKYAVPYGWEEYGQEMKYAAPWPFGPVAGYHSRGVRGWIEANEPGCNITLASECNMAAFRDLGANPEPGCLIQPLLLRTVRSCGDNNLYYTQKGEHQFRFALQSQAEAARLGEEHNSPLLTCLVEHSTPLAGSMPDKLSFAQVKPDHVQLAVVKQAEDGRGIVLRLVAMKKSQGQVPLEIRLFRPIKEAHKTSIIEENQTTLAAPKDTITLPIGPLSIETLRIGF